MDMVRQKSTKEQAAVVNEIRQDNAPEKKAEAKGEPAIPIMTYEAHLDEVATLLVELYDMGDEAAIQTVMRAQADDFFSGHDDDPSLCTLDRAHQDAKGVFQKYR